MEAIENGTGKARISDWQIAGKTGTTQNARDAWFVGFTSSYVGGVWIGKDDNSPLTGVIGGNLPTIVWARIMEKIHKKTPNNLPSLSQKNNNLLLVTLKLIKCRRIRPFRRNFGTEYLNY